MTQRVLVAGSSGGIGSELARQLRAAGFTVFTLSRSGSPSDFHCVADLSSPDSIPLVQNFYSRRSRRLFSVAPVCCITIPTARKKS